MEHSGKESSHTSASFFKHLPAHLQHKVDGGRGDPGRAYVAHGTFPRTAAHRTSIYTHVKVADSIPALLIQRLEVWTAEQRANIAQQKEAEQQHSSSRMETKPKSTHNQKEKAHGNEENIAGTTGEDGSRRHIWTETLGQTDLRVITFSSRLRFSASLLKFYVTQLENGGTDTCKGWRKLKSSFRLEGTRASATASSRFVSSKSVQLSEELTHLQETVPGCQIGADPVPNPRISSFFPKLSL